MPELVEVERYRSLAESLVGWRVAAARVMDPRVLRGRAAVPALLEAALVGRRITAARRRGKLLLLDSGPSPAPARAARAAPQNGPTIGIRFGMTGTLVVDGRPGVDRLVYSPGLLAARWVRFELELDAGPRQGVLALHDPRRLGRVELDPDEDALGPDAAGVARSQLRRALAGSAAPLKARLMDQGRIAGVGNLMADEVLWRASLSPLRTAGGLDAAELRRLHRHLLGTVDVLTKRGGSHTGDLMGERHPGGRCPRDGGALARSTVGGRTTWWCPEHQH